MKALLAAVVMAAAPPPGPVQEPLPTGLQEWLRARAHEFETGEKPAPLPPVEVKPLWSERPRGLPLPKEFNPPTSLGPLIRTVSPAVVHVTAYLAEDSTTHEGESPGPGPTPAVGSGFILGPDGYVVTNHHVVTGAQEIRIHTADDRDLGARVVGTDASTDLALLKIEGDRAQGLPSVVLGDSDRLEVGDWVVAIGNPLGFDHSVSHGIISAKERVLGMGMFDDFIQTDALMNPGNSGGPLFNMRGEVVGVNTAMMSHAQGLGFAVPINMVKDLLPNLQKNGRLARGWLGLSVAEEVTGTPRKDALVKDVYPGGPAMEAGLHDGDRIVAVNGHPVESYLQLLRKVALSSPGSTVKLSVMRGGTARDFSVQVVERPAEDVGSPQGGFGTVEGLGLVLQDVDGTLAATLHVPPYHGVLVSSVVTQGAAERAGLKEGDLITSLNKQHVDDIHSFLEQLGRPGARKAAVSLRVERGDRNLTLSLGP